MAWKISTAAETDLDAVTEIEAACFPAAEAATREEFAQRLRFYPNHFWLLEEDGRCVAFINGMVSNEPVILDEQYADASLHDENGAWQAIFGVDTLPEYRRNGCAARLMEQVIADARAQGRKGCVLACKDKLIHYYEKFGYRSYGISSSVHGGVTWYDMRLEF